MTKIEQDTIWIGAFRYYLGRTTYAVSDFCTILIKEWDSLPECSHIIIKRELDAAFLSDDETRVTGGTFFRLGHDCDRAEW
jgi:hypothetical protein